MATLIGKRKRKSTKEPPTSLDARPRVELEEEECTELSDTNQQKGDDEEVMAVHMIKEEESEGEDKETKEEEETIEEGEERGVMNDPFYNHYDGNLKESEVVELREFYSRPLVFEKQQHKVLGVVQWMATPTCSSTIDTLCSGDIEQKILRDYHVREPLCTLWPSANKTSVSEPFTSLQYHLFKVMNMYKDLVYTQKSFENEAEIRRLYVLHCLNHIIKNRTRVLKNNIRLSMAAKEGHDLGDIRDQGLTRPKVLMIVPFRHSALKIVSTMIDILVTPGKGEVANRKKFYKLYSEDKEIKPPDYKPDSYHQIFSGNIDDCFRIGLAVKKNRLKLFTPFYSSDVIIASPLGLRTVIGGEGEKGRDYDFLSSLEIIIVDQTDVFLMQNWEHLMDIFKHLHLQPSDGHGVDFSRVREWSLNCWNQYYCQLIVLSSFPTPEINSVVTSYSHNYEGQLRAHTSHWKGSICQITKSIPQVFHNLKCTNHQMLPEIRYQYFIDTILPQLSSVDHVCIYIPSYFDFVRVRNFLKKEEYSFCHISEYTKTASVSRARSNFAKGDKKFLLITERFHFFRRYHLKGIHHLIFYAPPTYNEFYSELINQCTSSSSGDGKVIVLYSSLYDVLTLQRIVGTDTISNMINSSDSIHTIVLQ